VEPPGTSTRRRCIGPAGWVAVCLAVAVTGCAQQGEADDEPHGATDQSAIEQTVEPDPVAQVPGAAWSTAAPENHDLDPLRLDNTVRYVEGLDSNCLVVVKDGYLMGSWYWNDTTPTTEQEVFSVTKSLTGTLVGIAQDRGLLDIDEPASTYIEEWRGTASEAVTTRHLLSMDSGLRWDTQTDLLGLLTADDKRAFAIGLSQEHPPGMQWTYSSASAELVGEVLERATGETVEDFARANLFTPLGMRSTMMSDSAGNTMTSMGWQASCLDVARFGYLALHQGAWGADQLVSREWFNAATGSSQELMTPHGYLWWHNDDGRRMARSGDVVDDGTYSWPDSPADTFSAEGTANQLLIVVPSEALIVVRLGPGTGTTEPEVVGNEILRLLLGKPPSA
jgi:CubicO group peptidase (beta-lactamase class C family)